MLEIKSQENNLSEIKCAGLEKLNPHFTEIGHEIVLPNITYEDYTKSREHQASFIHEYYHFLQAVCTLSGIYHFFGITEKIISTLAAVKERPTIYTPFSRYAHDNQDQKGLIEYVDCLKNFKTQRDALVGS